MSVISLGQSLKAEFPIFQNNVQTKDGKQLPLVYLDTAATAQKPQVVIGAMTSYLERDCASAHRGNYRLSAKTTDAYEKVRQQVAFYLDSTVKASQIVFTKSTTESLNLIARALGEKHITDRSRIVTTELEHHSNLLPWQQVALDKNCEIAYVPLEKKSLKLDLSQAEKLITKNTAVVALAHMGNVLGQINDLLEIIAMAKKVGAFVVVDSAQSISCLDAPLFQMGVDAVAFSAHKMYGPTGIGVLVLSQELAENCPPLLYGGGAIQDVTLEGLTFLEAPHKFEPGTPPVTEAVGLGAAISFLQQWNKSEIHAHLAKLNSKFAYELEKIPGISVYSQGSGQETLTCFSHERCHPHDMATILDTHNVCVRAGHHCAYPLIRRLGVAALTRVSFGIYSSEEDVDAALFAIKESIEIF